MGNRASSLNCYHNSDVMSDKSSTTSRSSSTSSKASRRSRQGKRTNSGGAIVKDTKTNKPSSSVKDATAGRSNPVPENASDAIKTALQWVKAKGDKDLMKLYLVCDQDAKFDFVDMDVCMPMREFWDAMMGLMQAFPDLSFAYSKVEEIEPGIVQFENYIGYGHHTGLFEFAGRPDLRPTGTYVADEPIQLTVYVDTGTNKITKMVADTFGGLAGPPGFYEKAKAAQKYLEPMPEQ